MEQITVIFEESIKRTDEIFSFRFSINSKVPFLAGQFLKVYFNESDKNDKTLNKFLSFSSSPQKDYIEVTKRLTGSDFSKKLENLKAGDKVKMEMPFGKCTLTNDEKFGFIVGGIGITPVISMIEQLVLSKTHKDIFLIYSNREKNDIAFKEELDLWMKNYPSLKVHYSVDSGEPVMGGTTGFITGNLIKKVIPDFKTRKIYIFGPPVMVKIMKNAALELGCNIDSIIIEQFMGY